MDDKNRSARDFHPSASSDNFLKLFVAQLANVIQEDNKFSVLFLVQCSVGWVRLSISCISRLRIVLKIGRASS